MARHPFQRRGHALVPVTQDGRDAVNRIAHGAEVMASIQPARNVRQFRLFWALCEILSDNSSDYDTKEKAKKGLLYATGHVDIWFDHAGAMHIDPRSIAFENMKPDEFDDFFRAAVRKICDWLGTAPDEVIERVNDMVDAPRPASRDRKTKHTRSPSIAPDRTAERERSDA